MGFLKKIINWLLNAILVVSIVVSIWIFSQVSLLETDARRTAVRPQCDTAAGTDRDTPHTGISESQAG